MVKDEDGETDKLGDGKLRWSQEIGQLVKVYSTA